MHLIDWLLVILPVVTVASIAFYTQRYMHGVSDFMSGGRLAGRYLLTVAKSEMQAGAVVFVRSNFLPARDSSPSGGSTSSFW